MENKIMKMLALLGITTLSIYNLIANDVESYINKDHDIIHLMAENHADAECIKLRNLLREESENEHVILALEGGMVDEQYEGNSFGIEDPLIFYVSSVLTFYRSLTSYKIIQDYIALNNEEPSIEVTKVIDFFRVDLEAELFGRKDLVDLLANLSWINSINPTNFRAILADNIIVLRKINKLIGPSGTFSVKPNTQFIENHSLETPFFFNLHNDISQWIDLLEDIINSYLEEAVRQNRQITVDTINQVVAHAEKIQPYLGMDNIAKRNACSIIKDDFSEFSELWNNIARIERSHIFLKNIISIFENNKWKKKPFFVFIGATHAPFLYKQLKQLGYNVELNEWGQEYHLEELITDGLIDKKASDNLIKFAIKKLNHEKFHERRSALGLLEKLIDAQLINKETIDTYGLGALVIEKLGDNDWMINYNALDLLNKLVDTQLIDKATVATYKLGVLAIDMLGHDRWEVQYNAMWLLGGLVKNDLLDKETVATYRLGTLAIEKLNHDQWNVQEGALILLIALVDKNLIDKEMVATYGLVTLVIEKLSHNQWDIQYNAIWLLRKLVVGELVPPNSIDNNKLGKGLIDKFDKLPEIILFLLSVSIEKQLIDKQVLAFYEFDKRSIEKLEHDNIWVKANALWFLSLALEEKKLLATDAVVKAIEDCHQFLVNSKFKLPKYGVKRLVVLFRKFLVHPAIKTRFLAAEIIELLEKMLPAGETCTVEGCSA